MRKIEQFLDIKKNRIFVLICILLVGLGLRMYQLDAHSVWCDEVSYIQHSLGITYAEKHYIKDIDSLQDFWKYDSFENIKNSVYQKSGGNSLLYTFLLNFWIKTFGTSDAILRFFSIITSILSGIVIYKLGKNLKLNNFQSLLLCFLLMISHLNIQYSQEIRAYSLTLLFALLSTIQLIKLCTNTEKKIINYFLYGIFILLGIYSHFLIIYIILGHGIYFFTKHYNQPKMLIPLTIIYGSIFMILLIWYKYDASHIFDSMSKNGQKWVKYAQEPNSKLATTPINFIEEIFQITLQVFNNGMHYTFRLRYIVFTVILIPIFCYFGSKKISSDAFFLGFSIFIGHLLLSSIMAIKSGHLISFIPKYATFSAPFVAILIVGAISFFLDYSKILGYSLFSFLLLTNSIALFSIYTDNLPTIGVENPRGKNPHYAVSIQLETKQENAIIKAPYLSDIILLSFYSKKDFRFEVDSTLKDLIIVSNSKSEILLKNTKQYLY